MINFGAVSSIFNVDLVEDGEGPVILLIFVRNFDVVAELESGTHITPLVDKDIAFSGGISDYDL